MKKKRLKAARRRGIIAAIDAALARRNLTRRDLLRTLGYGTNPTGSAYRFFRRNGRIDALDRAFAELGLELVDPLTTTKGETNGNGS